MKNNVKKIVLFGAGGLASEVIWSISGINAIKQTYDIVGLVVEKQYFHEGMEVDGYSILGTEEWLFSHKDEVGCHCAIGIPSERARIQRMLVSNGIKMESIIGADVNIAPSAKVGVGTYLAGRVCVSTNCVVGDGVLLNGEVVIGHDSKVGDYTCIMTRADLGGRCSVGSEVLIGAHAYIVPDRKIGDGATVAAGSIVFSNVKAGTTVLGNPAKRMRFLEMENE